jgi:hypothetical protein
MPHVWLLRMMVARADCWVAAAAIGGFGRLLVGLIGMSIHGKYGWRSQGSKERNSWLKKRDGRLGVVGSLALCNKREARSHVYSIAYYNGCCVKDAHGRLGGSL